MIKIEDMLNKPYGLDLQGQSRRYVCWHFCRKIYKMFGLQLKNFHLTQELRRIEEPVVPCIVLFRAAMNWHSGVVWPDGLHFVHACPLNIFDLEPKVFYVRKDRLTIWPFRQLIEGYYINEDNTC